MLWALEAGVAGSCPVKATSVRPVILARLGTDADMLTVPVDVAPNDPSVAACAGPTKTEAPSENKTAYKVFLFRPAAIEIFPCVMCEVREISLPGNYTYRGLMNRLLRSSPLPPCFGDPRPVRV